MFTRFITSTIVAAVVLTASPAAADWFPGDGHKMHFPQLPDPNGWDVDVTTDTVYDDFLCSETGPIKDIHFWASWKQDLVGQISWIDVSLHGDVPAGTDPDPLIPYSHPDSVMYSDPNTLWLQRFLPGQFIVAPPEFGNQGWLAPSFTQPQWNHPDHQQFFQINIPQIDDPFIQEKDTVYWLGIHIGLEGPLGPEIGWKTTLDHWNDDAAYVFDGWQEMIDPLSGESLDMAFVITPEPASLALLTLGTLTMLRRRNN
jgi:hypothetical protein